MSEYELIKEAIMKIEAEWIEYNNGSITADQAESNQVFVIRELIEELAQ